MGACLHKYPETVSQCVLAEHLLFHFMRRRYWLPFAQPVSQFLIMPSSNQPIAYDVIKRCLDEESFKNPPHLVRQQMWSHFYSLDNSGLSGLFGFYGLFGFFGLSGLSGLSGPSEIGPHRVVFTPEIWDVVDYVE